MFHLNVQLLWFLQNMKAFMDHNIIPTRHESSRVDGIGIMFKTKKFQTIRDIFNNFCAFPSRN